MLQVSRTQEHLEKPFREQEHACSPSPHCWKLGCSFHSSEFSGSAPENRRVLHDVLGMLRRVRDAVEMCSGFLQTKFLKAGVCSFKKRCETGKIMEESNIIILKGRDWWRYSSERITGISGVRFFFVHIIHKRMVRNKNSHKTIVN